MCIMNLRYDCIPRNLALAETFDVHLCNGFSLPSFAIKFLKEHALSFKARDDDVYVISYPKTGTTWVQKIVFLVLNHLDFDTAKSESLDGRFPLEHARTDVGSIEEMPSPRLIKSHFPYSCLPPDILKKKCKIIYVTRNPKDVVVSYFHFAQWLNETRFRGTFDQFLERFLLNRPTYSPFLKHNLEFWNHRTDDNILFLFYEDLQKDLFAEVLKIADFLGKKLSKEEIEKIVDQCTFKNMAGSKSVTPASFLESSGSSGKFFRKGKVGDWKNYFSTEQSERMDTWIKETLAGTDLTYTYEL